MKYLIIIPALILGALFAPIIVCAKRSGRRLAFNSLIHPDGQITLKPEEAFASPYLIGTRGSSASEVAVAAAGELPLCIVEDEADTDDVTRGEGINCAVLGATEGTKRVQAAGAVPIDTDVYSIGGGLVDVIGDAASGDYCVGRSASSTSEAGELVIVPELPTRQKA